MFEGVEPGQISEQLQPTAEKIGKQGLEAWKSVRSSHQTLQSELQNPFARFPFVFHRGLRSNTCAGTWIVETGP